MGLDTVEEQLEAARRTGAERVEAAGRSGASSLDLSGLMLAALPDSLRELTTLTQLNLAGNRLTELPDWLTGLTTLTQLDLSANRLAALPDRLGDLTALTRLDLTGNQLTALPDSLGRLTALTRLFLTANRLTALPASLGSLTALTRLDLAGNQLTAVPDWLGRPGRDPMNTPLQAWIDGTPTRVDSAAHLDALLDRLPPSGVTLTAEGELPSLFVDLAGDQSALMWEDDEDIMISWGPVPAGSPAGQTTGDAEYAYADPWFTGSGDEPPALTADQARRAAHEFLGTGRRPTSVQWVEKP